MEHVKPAEKCRLTSLLLIVFVWRLFFALIIWKINGPSGFISPDTASYVEPAKSLLHGSFSAFGAPEIFRTPGYPLLLLPALALHHITIIALLENFLLAMVSGGLIWKMASELFPNSAVGFWAVILYCFEPSGLEYSQRILSETLFTTLVLLFAWCMVRFLRAPAYWMLTKAAMALACATYVRPVPLYLGLWLVPLFCAFPRTLSWHQRLSRAILFQVLFLLLLAPWVIRNSTVAGYKGFSCSSAWNLYFMAAAATEAHLQHKSFTEISYQWGNSIPPQAAEAYSFNDNHRILLLLDADHYFDVHPEQKNWSQAEIARFWSTQAGKTLSAHWMTYFAIHARGCAMVLLNPGVSEILRDLGRYPRFGGATSSKLDQGFFQASLWLFRSYPIASVLLPLTAALLVSYYLLALKGLRNMPSDISAFFALVFLYFVIVSGFPAATARYRTPVMPLVCLCAGVGIAKWKKKPHSFKAEPAVGPA